MLLRMRLACLVADALGIKEATGAKGTSGIKPCIRCMNVVNHKAKSIERVGRLPAGLVLDTSLAVETYVQATDDVVHAIVSRLAGGRDASGNIDQLCTNLGWNFLPESWMTDTHLPRPLVSVIHFDWMHCLFIQGVFTTEAPGAPRHGD